MGLSGAEEPQVAILLVSKIRKRNTEEYYRAFEAIDGDKETSDNIWRRLLIKTRSPKSADAGSIDSVSSTLRASEVRKKDIGRTFWYNYNKIGRVAQN